jgi:hypothetical protein
MNEWHNDFLQKFDALQSNTIFCAWTGTNSMSAQRIQALWSIYSNTRCPVVFVNRQSLKCWEKTDSPFHPGYEYLSDTHKSDYLRCYLMHHFGGGWTDVKHTTADWRPLFAELRRSSALALGYQELADGIPHLDNPLGDELRKHHLKNIGLCAFIYKRYSNITYDWYRQVHVLMDHCFEELRANPATQPQEVLGMKLPNNTHSNYPLRWAQILGEILHPITFRNKEKLLHGNIAPLFHSYR